MAQNALTHVANMAAIGEAVVEAVRESGVLKRKPGRKKQVKRKRKSSGKAPAKIAKAPKTEPAKKPKPVPVEETETDDEE